MKINFSRLTKKNKRGMGVGDIYPVVLTIALVAILIGITLFVLNSLQPQVSTLAFGVSNETGAYLNSSMGLFQVAASNATTCGFNSFEVLYVTNRTTGLVITAANYSTTITSSGALTNTTATAWNDLNISYNYHAGGLSCSSMRTIQAQIYGFIPWIGIILLVIAAAIVLGVLIRNLAGGQSRV